MAGKVGSAKKHSQQAKSLKDTNYMRAQESSKAFARTADLAASTKRMSA